MVTAEQVTEELKKLLALMDALKGRELGGFAIIMPPEGDSIILTNVGYPADAKSFMKMLADKIAASLDSERSQFGAIRPGR